MTRTTLRKLTSAALLSLAFALTPTSAAASQPGVSVTPGISSWLSLTTLRGMVIAAWHHLFASAMEPVDPPSPPNGSGSSYEPLGNG